MLKSYTEMYMDIIGIYLLDQNMGMAFVKVQMYTYTIGIGKVSICFKPFGFLLEISAI